VFSSWKTTIQLLAAFLNTHEIKASIVEGSMSVSQRKKEIEKFQQNPDISVLLMTFGTGAVG
jgi:SWI/SNF-related matrix-associated actin-dependent regulator of chromatin subfamily A3